MITWIKRAGAHEIIRRMKAYQIVRNPKKELIKKQEEILRNKRFSKIGYLTKIT